MLSYAEFVFETDDPMPIYRALAPELKDELQRSRVDIVLREGSIGLMIRGDDVVSFRAALNTWIRLIKIAFEMVNI